MNKTVIEVEKNNQKYRGEAMEKSNMTELVVINERNPRKVVTQKEKEGNVNKR